MSTELQPRTRQPIVLATVEHQLRQQHRLMLLPPLASTGTVLGGGWLHDRMLATLAAGGPEMLVIGLGGGIVAGVISTGLATLYAARAGSLDGLPEGRKLFGGSAAAGLALALFGDTALLVAVTYGGGLLGLGNWYRKRFAARVELKKKRLALTSTTKDPEPEPVNEEAAEEAAVEVIEAEVVEPDTIITLWQQGATKYLPGTRLIPITSTSYVVQAGPAGVTLARANAAREDIASALHLAIASPTSGGQDIVFDQPTDGTLTNRSQLRAQIIDLRHAAAAGKRVTAEIEHAPANPCAVRIGGYIDDGSPYYWVLADADGAHSGVILGGTGMGKSCIGDQLAYKAARLGFEVAYLDPQRGASSPVLAQYAHYPALGEEYAAAFISFLEDAADTRETWLAMHPAAGGTIRWGMVAPCAPGGGDPDPGCPCGGRVPPPLVAFIEECDQVFNATVPGTSTKLGDRAGVLAKKVRKLCMELVGLTQLPELKTFGGSEMLRSNLPKNFVAMHVSSNVSGTLIPGLPYSPRLLPKTKARALACGEYARSMQVTMDYLPRRAKAADGLEGPYAEDLFEALPVTERYRPDLLAWQRLFPANGESVAEANRDSARARFLAKTTDAAPATPHPPTPPAAAVPIVARASVIQWPDPVVSWQPSNEAELRAALDEAADLVGRLLAAAKGMRDDEWITVSALAKRIGDVAEDAPLSEVQAAGREIGRVLAAVGIESTKREPGMSVTAGALRAAWS